MTPDAHAPTRTSLGQRERSPLRVWVQRHQASSAWKAPWWQWRCPACWRIEVSIDGFLPKSIAAAAAHARTCPALRLARLEAELEKLAELFRREGDWNWNQGEPGYALGADHAWARLTDILARHRQARQ
jgi:hypothetical protein